VQFLIVAELELIQIIRVTDLFALFFFMFPHLKRQDLPNQECPVCFNCQLPTNNCVNGGRCDPSGACHCPVGWGKPFYAFHTKYAKMLKIFFQ
jgi:hypothetical protein